MGARVVTDPSGIAALREGWDALAVACARPLSAPAWLMAWWRHLAPPGAALRVAVAEEDGRLVAVAPFFAEGRALPRLRPLAAGMSVRAAPLAEPGREAELAPALAAALAGSRPRPGVVHLEQIDAGSPWPQLLADAWPGPLRARLERVREAPAPVVTLPPEGYEAWFASLSSNARQRMRRDRRKLDAAGMTSRLADAASLDADLDAFHRMHAARWGDQSPLSAPAGMALMRDAGRELIASGRFRVWVLEIDGAPLSVQVFVAAGGEVAYWNGGWDPAWAAQSPAMHGILAGIEDAARRGDRRVDLGEDDHAYKRRLADADAPIAWFELAPRGPRYGLARAATLPRHARPAAARALHRLPPAVRTPLERARAAAGGLRRGR